MALDYNLEDQLIIRAFWAPGHRALLRNKFPITLIYLIDVVRRLP